MDLHSILKDLNEVWIKVEKCPPKLDKLNMKCAGLKGKCRTYAYLSVAVLRTGGVASTGGATVGWGGARAGPVPVLYSSATGHGTSLP